MVNPGEIIRFWIEELGEAGWYAVDEAVDAAIRDRFGAAWETARAGGLGAWCDSPEGTLAFLILTDQFPRNMFRGDGRSFVTDALALGAAKAALERGQDMRVPAPQRQFFYLPLMHSEVMADQDRSVRLFLTRMPEAKESLAHARAHREVIRRFGRFPYRNAALGRRSKPAEEDYLAAGGYGHTLRQLGVA